MSSLWERHERKRGYWYVVLQAAHCLLFLVWAGIQGITPNPSDPVNAVDNSTAGVHISTPDKRVVSGIPHVAGNFVQRPGGFPDVKVASG